jgi:predicted nucleic acid-binding protein
MVVVDTNVLLNLYRYHPVTREDLFRIIEALGERLFVPHQVASEFWANREATIRASTEETTQLRDALDGHRGRSLQAIATWAERVALPPATREQLAEFLARAYDEVAAQVDAFSSEGLGVSALDTNTDPVLQRVAVLLQDRIGPPLAAAALEEARAEAERRISEEVPPGYADSTKTGDSRHGDYLLWKELLIEAAERRVDVLLVREMSRTTGGVERRDKRAGPGSS